MANPADATYDLLQPFVERIEELTKERDEERALHAKLSAEYHDATRKTCTSLASQVEALTKERDRLRMALRSANERLKRNGCLPVEVKP